VASGALPTIPGVKSSNESAQAPPHDFVTVVVESRDLDTDERSISKLTVPAPETTTDQRIQLAEAAARFHPGAPMRSFADGAATFLDRQHLIVASYEAPPAPRKGVRADGIDVQAPLFA
jgi:hypothetical protein